MTNVFLNTYDNGFVTAYLTQEGADAKSDSRRINRVQARIYPNGHMEIISQDKDKS
jgi:hypothetical protein